MTHDELIKRGAKWLEKNYNYRYHCQIVLTEFKSLTTEIPDIWGANHYRTTIIECKISLADFKSDLQKNHRNNKNSLGNQRFYLCPAGLIPVEQIPENWGLLYAHKKNISIIKEPTELRDPEIRNEEWYILYSLIIRAKIDGLLPIILRTAEQRKTEKQNIFNQIPKITEKRLDI
jgi:hypothetical protein